MDEPDRLSASPNPVPAGGNLTVCYTFPSDGPDEVTINFDWSPSSVGDFTRTASRSEECVTVTVPDGAISVVLSAPGSSSLSVPVKLSP